MDYCRECKKIVEGQTVPMIDEDGTVYEACPYCDNEVSSLQEDPDWG